jgi:hypothetical protein
VCVGIRAPIEPGAYAVREKTVQVSYPDSIATSVALLQLPKSLSTLFVVSWEDISGTITAQLQSKSHERYLPIYSALEAISDVLRAFKLVRIGHYEGTGLRTIGIGDTLVAFSSIDGCLTGDLNIRLKNYDGNNAWPLPDPARGGPYETTKIARPYIGKNTLPIARRYVRCYELVEYGFYAEAFIVAFSVLDDFVQQTLHVLFDGKGLTSKGERNELVRGIKENRLKLFLGPLLKLAYGRDLKDMWPNSVKAMEWLNETRNGIAHRADTIDYATAVWGIYACLKVFVIFNEYGVASTELTVELFRHAKISAAWTSNAPEWVPSGELAESMDYRS